MRVFFPFLLCVLFASSVMSMKAQSSSHDEGAWLVIFDRNGDANWIELYEGANGDYVNVVELHIAEYGQPYVYYYFVYNGIRYGAPDYFREAYLNWPQVNPLIEGNGYYYIESGRPYSIGIHLEEDLMYQYVASGWWVEPIEYFDVGDVDTDGIIGISDITWLIDCLLKESPGGLLADVDCDGKVGISDVTVLIDSLLSTPSVEVTEDDDKIVFTVKGAEFTMIRVEGGTFIMGATTEQETPDEWDESFWGPDVNEYPIHQVTLSNYCIGQTEVTQKLWTAVMGSNPSYFSINYNYYGTLQRPVESVSWNDCQAFISRLNALTGWHFRLPTEAEWEYAARGGAKSQGYKYAGSNDINRVAWWGYDENNTFMQTHPVAKLSPNELGLYDMSGNVQEWCQDWYGAYNGEAQIDPKGPNDGTDRVYRGGNWYVSAWDCRISTRAVSDPANCGYWTGLRLAL